MSRASPMSFLSEANGVKMLTRDPEEDSLAERRAEPAAVRDRSGDSDGRAAATLLASGRGCGGVQPADREGSAHPGRGPGPVPRQERELRARGPALPAPPRGHDVRFRRGTRPALQLPRLAVRPHRAVPSPAVRGDPAPGGHASRTRSASRRTRYRRKPASSGSTWGRGRRRCCPTGTGITRAASSRSPSRRSRATGSSARRTRSTRSTSNGCMTTGHGCCAVRTAPRAGPPAARL